MADILIIEPDFHMGCRMKAALTEAGYHCRVSSSIADSLEIIQSCPRLLTILNARTSWSESFGLLQALSDRGLPVLFITSDPGNVQHLHALYQGCCSVLLSPFDASALTDAAAHLLAETNRLLTIGPLRLDTEKRSATLDGEHLTLTAQEFALLHALMQSPDAALTREELLRTAWGYQGIGETRTVDVHVQRLRRKLGASCIETVYKLGYRLKMA